MGHASLGQPLTKAVPVAEDVIVRRQADSPTVVYVLHTTAGADQLMARTREAAVAQALAFARGARVTAWLNRGHEDYELLGDFRQRRGEPSSRRVHEEPRAGERHPARATSDARRSRRQRDDRS